MLKCWKMCRVAGIFATLAWTAGEARGADPDLTALRHGLGSPDYAQREAASAELRKVPLEDQDTLMTLAARETDPEVAARLWGRVHEMDMERAARNAEARWEMRWPVLRGQVVDENGKGVAGARIDASGQLNTGLYWSPRWAERTDASGTFELRVPFADVVYSITAMGPGFGDAWGSALAEKGLTEPLVVRRRVLPKLVRARLVDQQGQGVPGRAVQLLGTYEQISARSGADGAISWRVEGYSEGSFTTWEMKAGEPGSVVPMRILQNADRPLDLVLEPSATLKGRITVKGTDQGVAGVRVVVRQPHGSMELLRETLSGTDGTYRVTGLPAGGYSVAVDSETHVDVTDNQRRQELGAGEVVSVKAGAEEEVNRQVLAVGVITGRVLDAQGRPADGALVAAPVSVPSMFGSWRQTGCDAQGRFWIAAVQIHDTAKCRVEAYSSTGGVGIEEVVGPMPGQVVRGVEVKLGGATRLTGVVVDENGKPVRDVRCGPSAVMTGEDGRFDLGQLAIRKNEPLNVTFQAPRPTRWEGDLGPWKRYQVTTRAEAPVFYLHTQRTLPVVVEPATRWEITLKRTPLVEIAGRVVDAGGLPVAGAKVNLMSGEVDEAAWKDVLNNSRGPATGSGGVSAGKGKAVYHQWVTSGPDGRWTIWYVKEESATEEGKRWAGPLSVGALLDSRLSAVRPLSQEELAGERCEVDVRLP